MRTLILSLSLLILFVPKAWAGLKIVQLKVDQQHGYLVASCQTSGDIPYEYLDEALKHGISLRVTFQITLLKVRPLFRDQVLLEEEVNRLLYYQAVKDDYLLQYVGATTTPQSFSSLEEALSKATTLKGLPLLPITQLQKNGHYRLKVRLVLRKEVNIPFPFTIPLRLLHFLFGGGKMESDWTSLDFRL